MSPTATTVLGAEVLDHLQAQIVSARRLLECILRQGAAVRAREVDGVLAAMTEIQAEMGARSRMEHERATLLHRAGAALGLPAPNVTLEAIAQLMAPAEAVEDTGKPLCECVEHESHLWPKRDRPP